MDRAQPHRAQHFPGVDRADSNLYGLNLVVWHRLSFELKLLSIHIRCQLVVAGKAKSVKTYTNTLWNDRYSTWQHPARDSSRKTKD